MLEGRNAVYIESVTGTRSVRLFTEIGQAIPAHTSGSGKALLAWRATADVEALLGGGPLPASTPRTLTTVDGAAGGPGATSAAAATRPTTRSTSWASPASRRPVLDATGLPLAAISVSGPTPRIAADTAGLAELLRGHAEQVHGRRYSQRPVATEITRPRAAFA